MGRVATNHELNKKILVDLKAGVKWAEIREKHGVENDYINSVRGIYQAEISRHKGQDNEKPSPVKTFNINDLSDEELERMGLGRFKKNA